jgi:very-short-patch-repair endonuclease
LVTRLIEADDAHTKSEFERRFLRFLKAQQLPPPDALNEDVAGHKADCVYRTRHLVVELDGRAYHRRRAQMRADRHRDVDYQLDGYLILRLVWDDLHDDEAAATARRVRRMLRL